MRRQRIGGKHRRPRARSRLDLLEQPNQLSEVNIEPPIGFLVSVQSYDVLELPRAPACAGMQRRRVGTRRCCQEQPRMRQCRAASQHAYFRANHPSQAVHGGFVCRLFGCGSTTRTPRGSTVSQHPSSYANPSGGRRSKTPSARAKAPQGLNNKNHIYTRTRGWGGAARARGYLGRRAVLERRRVRGRRRREHVGHLRRP